MIRGIVIFACMVWLVVGVLAQGLPREMEVKKDVQAVFQHYTTANGLSDMEVLCITQDRFGYYWIGSADGLNKFDGYNFQVFRHDPSRPRSLSGNIIECIEEDRDGNLWVGTNRGLNCYHRNSNDFSRYLHDPNNSASPGGNHVRAILASGDTSLWFETMEGTLNHLNRRTGVVTRYPHVAASQPEYHYHAIEEDREGRLWIGGRFMQVMWFDPREKVFHILATDADDPTRKRESDVSDYLEDGRGDFWVAGVDGFYQMDKTSGAVEKMLSISTWSMVEDAHGMLWLATGSGLFKFDPVRHLWTTFQPDPDNPQALAARQVNTRYGLEPATKG